jgi:hypothetical protein
LSPTLKTNREEGQMRESSLNSEVLASPWSHNGRWRNHRSWPDSLQRWYDSGNDS